MKSIHIRGLSEETLSGLKRRAARHRRSLQKEVQVLLEEAARMQRADAPAHLELRIVKTGQRGGWRREEFYGDQGANIAATLRRHGIRQLATDSPADFGAFPEIQTDW